MPHLYLFLSIVFSTSFGLIMKHAQEKRYNVLAVGGVNYIVAGVVSLLALAMRADASISPAPVTLTLGCLGGCFYLVSYIFIMLVLKRRGISIPIAMTRLAVAIPILFSIFVWRETPNKFQIMGMVFMIPSLFLLSYTPNRSLASRPKWATVLSFALFFSSGGTRLIQKAFNEVCPEAQRPFLIAMWFGASAVASVIVLVATGTMPKWSDLLLGAALGVVNISDLFFVLQALKVLRGIVVFPVLSCAGLALTTFLAVSIWGERLERRAKVGILLALLVLALVNIG